MRSKAVLSLTLLASAVLGGLATAPLAEAAKRLGPPSDFMREPQNKSAVLTAVEPAGEGLYAFALEKALQGETAETITLRVWPQAQEQLESGRSYLVGYTELWKPRNRRTSGYQVDPRGPGLLEVPAVGPALFESSPAMRSLVAPAEGEKETSDRAALEAILTQVRRPDVQSRRFVLAELVLRPELRQLANEADVATLRRTLESGELEPLALDYFLRAAGAMVDTWGGDWLATACRKAIAGQGATLDLLSPIPSLLVVAFETLGQTGEKSDALLADPHLASNNPGVGKAAFEAMALLDPEVAAERAPAALASDEVHPDTKRRVEAFLNARGDASGG